MRVARSASAKDRKEEHEKKENRDTGRTRKIKHLKYDLLHQGLLLQRVPKRAPFPCVVGGYRYAAADPCRAPQRTVEPGVVDHF